MRLLVAEDQSAVRAGLVLILRSAPDIQMLGEAADGEQELALTRRLRPDLVLVTPPPRKRGDFSLKSEDPRDGQALTAAEADEQRTRPLRAGASGFLLKNTEARQLLEAVRTVAGGEGLIAPAVTRRLIAEFAARPVRDPGPGPEVLEALTRREREVLSCLGEGMSNAEIASRLEMAEATVKTHVSRLLGKLELRSRVQAAVLAQELGV
ncbi:response regulator transcription factor [Streptomyces sp. NBC_00828]